MAKLEHPVIIINPQRASKPLARCWLLLDNKGKVYADRTRAASRARKARLQAAGRSVWRPKRAFK